MLSDWVLTAPSLLPLTQGFDSFEILSILTKGKLYLNGVLQGFFPSSMQRFETSISNYKYDVIDFGIINLKLKKKYKIR